MGDLGVRRTWKSPMTTGDWVGLSAIVTAIALTALLLVWVFTRPEEGEAASPSQTSYSKLDLSNGDEVKIKCDGSSRVYAAYNGRGVSIFVVPNDSRCTK